MGISQQDVYRLREKNGLFPVYKMIDTCASEFSSYVPILLDLRDENESVVSDKEKIVVLGSADPYRPGR